MEPEPQHPARRGRIPVRGTVAAVLVLGLLGCGGPAAQDISVGPNDAPSPTSDLPVERYFPLVDRHVYQYATTADDGSPGVLIAKVRRPSEEEGELELGGRTRRFRFTEAGVEVVVAAAGGPRYVLKTPLSVGTTWRGEHGGQTQISAVGVAKNTLAGSFQDCIETMEQRGGDIPLRFVTTFCPDVGIVLLEASSANAFERAELKTYGPPVDIGPDGLIRVP